MIIPSLIIEPLPGNRFRMITPDGVAIIAVTGLDDTASPELTITQSCADCGKEIASITYDAMTPPPDDAIGLDSMSAFNAMRDHWAAHRGS